MAQRESILVVDDELGPRESLRMILKPIYEVHTAADGREALQFIDKEKIDLVTLDLKMPGIPGLDVLREIKKHQEDIEVIIVTGYGSLANAMEAIRCGAVDFISKPFDVADIVAVIKIYDGKSQAGEKPADISRNPSSGQHAAPRQTFSGLSDL
jgi:DNA-binding NtrC family response regulator